MIVKYRCPICGITETEDDRIGRAFRGDNPLSCDGPTMTFRNPDGVKRSPHEMTEMEVVPS